MGKIIIGFIIAVVFFAILGKVLMAGIAAGKTTAGGDGTAKVPQPSQADLLAKGYSQEEVMQIIASAAYKNGTGTW